MFFFFGVVCFVSFTQHLGSPSPRFKSCVQRHDEYLLFFRRFFFFLSNKSQAFFFVELCAGRDMIEVRERFFFLLACSFFRTTHWNSQLLDHCPRCVRIHSTSPPPLLSMGDYLPNVGKATASTKRGVLRGGGRCRLRGQGQA